MRDADNDLAPHLDTGLLADLFHVFNVASAASLHPLENRADGTVGVIGHVLGGLLVDDMQGHHFAALLAGHAQGVAGGLERALRSVDRHEESLEKAHAQSPLISFNW